MFNIREMREADLESVMELCVELGYPVSLEELKIRYFRLKASDIHAVFVAETEATEVIAWAHVAASLALTDQIRCEIIGLVVTSGERRKGIGKQLVERCEAWGQQKGYGLIRVRSQALRESAHEFYKEIGYELKKIQNVFVKKLAEPQR